MAANTPEALGCRPGTCSVWLLPLTGSLGPCPELTGTKRATKVPAAHWALRKEGRGGEPPQGGHRTGSVNTKPLAFPSSPPGRLIPDMRGLDSCCRWEVHLPGSSRARWLCPVLSPEKTPLSVSSRLDGLLQDLQSIKDKQVLILLLIGSNRLTL